MATGKTCYTTFHAESVSAMVHRMENPPISLPRSLVSALNLVLLQRQVKVGTKMTRRVQSLTEIVGLDPETNELITNSVYSWNPADDTFLYSGHSYIYEHVALMKNLSMKEMEREVRNRVDLLDYMVAKDAQATRQKPYTHRDVGQLVAYYYKEPQKALAEARAELQRLRRPPRPAPGRAEDVAPRGGRSIHPRDSSDREGPRCRCSPRSHSPGAGRSSCIARTRSPAFRSGSAAPEPTWSSRVRPTTSGFPTAPTAMTGPARSTSVGPAGSGTPFGRSSRSGARSS